MAKTGPKPSDPEILRIRSIHAGSAGAKHKELGTEETPRRPQWLIGEGRKKWEMLVPQLKEMGVLATVDRDQLALYCKVYGEWRELGKLFEEQIRYTRDPEEKQLLRSGMYKTEKGNYAYHPLASRRRTLENQMERMASHFGLTPAARTGLAIRKKKKASGEKGRFFGAKKPGA